jgi:nicotinamide mononucleotide transporter
MFIFKHLYLTAGLYAVFLVLAVMGYVQWKRSLEGRQAAGERGPASPEPSVRQA